MTHVSGPVPTRELLDHLDEVFQTVAVRDYSPNGLQVEGRAEIRRMMTAVTASQNIVDEAVKRGVDALLVHHGYFWKGEDQRVVGMKKRRLAALLKADINLIAWHLPLDLHQELGNNVVLGQQLEWPAHGWGGNYEGKPIIGWHDLAEPLGAEAIAARITERLGRQPLLVGALDRQVRRIAWCTGGAQDYLQDAIDLGADCFISGEISERTTHLAREAGVIYAAAGHHATERGGVQALGRHLADHFGIDVEFVDDPNPV
ncbi:MAG: Nif3-like dinuclear metal center hexameric protein [Lautropia sp.]|nr:Nif3-like dinuclear metal center hexameric protein [Lautropia sp.]